MTQGYILKLQPSRRSTFLHYAESSHWFSEPVPDFKGSRSAPLVVFIEGEENKITHVAFGTGGIRAGTDLRKLKLSDIRTINRQITFQELLTKATSRVHKHIAHVIEHGGILPPKSFTSLYDLIVSIDPNIDGMLRRFSPRRSEAIQNLGKEKLSALASQKEAVNTALQLAGMDRKPLLEWTPETSSTPKSFLEGLPSAYLREDQVIANDLQSFPGLEYVRPLLTGGATFEDKRIKLDVLLANRLELEKQTGADLIYYNGTYNSFVLVQYKMMEKDASEEDFIYRLPNTQLTEEIARMDKMLEHIKKKGGAQNRHEYRLSGNPFFIKLCPRITMEPDSIGLSPGMYFTLDHWRFLETDEDLVGPKGGRRVGYFNVGRKINNTDFAFLVKNAWVGSTPSESALIEELVKEIISTGKSLILAVKTDKEENERSIMDEINDSEPF